MKVKTCSIGSMFENSAKNRYNDVLPYDETIIKINNFNERVPIKGYINGNYIEPKFMSSLNADALSMRGYDLNDLQNRPRHYIATQAPTPKTINTFIELSLELAKANIDKCCNIIMLTEFKEGNRVKSMNYINHITDIIGNDPSLQTEGLIEIREWETKGGLIIKHYHLRNWVDHASPPLNKDGSDPLIKLVNIIKGGEMLVHCSAGVGRTGTFIALDYILKEKKKIEENGFVTISDLFGVVASLKCCRMLMVQTESQYEYLKSVIVKA